MSNCREHPQGQQPPSWAIDEAGDELLDVEDPQMIAGRAREIAEEREDERHDEYDDPDQGGEG
jgi:hypothetical protein